MRSATDKGAAGALQDGGGPRDGGASAPSVRRGIRFHLGLASAFLVVTVLAIALYSVYLSQQVQSAAAEREALIGTAIRAARDAFDIGGQLQPQLVALTRVTGRSPAQGEASEIADAIRSIDARLELVESSLRAFHGLTSTASVSNGSGPAIAQLHQVRQALAKVRIGHRDLARAVSASVETHHALDARLDLVRERYGEHFQSISRIEVTMRALVSRALAVDLVKAAEEQRLQARLDGLLERELSWVATTHDLLTDSRELMGLVSRLVAEEGPADLARLQSEIDIYVKRLQVFRRLPDLPGLRQLELATAAYGEAASRLPSLMELKTRLLTDEGEVERAFTQATERVKELGVGVYDLTQHLAEQGGEALKETQAVMIQTQRLLQAGAVIAGFLVLGLIAYYLSVRVIKPLERLTDAMQRSSRRLFDGTSGGLRSDDLPAIASRTDEVGVMSRALQALHAALTEREQALLEHQARLRYLAHHDALTDLPNRALLSERIEAEMVRAMQGETSLLAVALLDLDGFKKVNDRFGHAVGDALLIAVTRRLRGALKEGGLLARLGGDEIVLLVPGLRRKEDAEVALNRAMSCFAEPFRLERGQELRVGASIGYTLYPEDPGPGDVLIRHADQAMYSAKRGGKSQLVRYDIARDRHESRYRLRLRRIEQALERGELALHYQPMLDLRSGCVVGAEALLRWQTPSTGMAGPDDMLATVRGTELAGRLDHWVLSTAIEHARRWVEQGHRMFVSVNVSAEQLMSKGLAQEVERLLISSDRRADPLLQLEIVETQALDNLDLVVPLLEACRLAGATLALDDFGTGYSSLTYARRLPVDTIKIDRSFVQGMLVSPEDRSIVEAVTALARALGCEILAEGVESEDQARVLRELGCFQVQGFGVAPPMPLERLLQWLKHPGLERKWPGVPLSAV